MLRFTILCTVLLLGSCAQPPKPADPVPNDDPPLAATPIQIDPAELAQRLEQAEAAFASGHLAYPKAGSAHTIYREILALDPTQEDALRGLERLVEHYIEQAMTALARGQYANARSMLARARLILPDHPSIEPSAEQIRLIMSAERQTLTLDPADLAAESTQLQTALQQFATGGTGQCRFTIKAKNDRQGRWIYQVMSAASAGPRLRAQLQIQSPAAVERLCFAS